MIDLATFGWAESNTAAQNTAAFDAFIASVSGGNGSHGVFPAGTFECNTLNLTASCVSLSGQGAGTHLINATANAPCIKFDNVNHSSVSHLRIGQKSGVTAVSGNCGILLDTTDNCRLDDVLCLPYPAQLHKGIVTIAARNTHLNRLYVANCLSNGYDLSGTSDFVGGELLSFSNGGSGFRFAGTSGIFANNLHAYGNDGCGFEFPSGATNQFVHGTGWLADSSGSYNWSVSNLNRSVFGECWGATQKSRAVNTYANGLIITGANCFDIGFSNSQFLNNNSHGVVIMGGATNIRLNGLMCGGTQGNGQSGAGSGIRIELATHVSVHGCHSHGNATNGMKTTAVFSDWLSIIGNDFSGNGGASTSYGHTGTNVQIGLNL